MSDAHGASKTKTYLIIFVLLGVLTAIEVYIGKHGVGHPNQHQYLGLTTPRALMLLLAVGKASLVGAFFMHLKWETAWLRFIAVMPACLLFFALWLLAEVIYRTPEPPAPTQIHAAQSAPLVQVPVATAGVHHEGGHAEAEAPAH